MTSVIDDIRSRMTGYPHAVVKYDDVSASYYPASEEGFLVRLVLAQAQDQERYFVCYGGCCQQEEDRYWSIRSESLRHRRVLHIEYAGVDLPEPLRWQEER